MKTMLNGIVIKLRDSVYGAVATLANGEEVRVSHRDYWNFLQEKENMAEGYEAIPYMNQLHLVAVPNPIYKDEE